MSDAILGTIIGGIIAVVSGVIGAVVQGLFSKSNAKLQFEQQEKQSRTQRLIDIRAENLKPLREEVKKCTERIMDAQGMLQGIVRMLAPGSNQANTTVNGCEWTVGEVDEIENDIYESAGNIYPYRAVITDDTLFKLLEKVKTSCNDADIPRIMGSIKNATESGSGNRRSRVDSSKDNYDAYYNKLQNIVDHLQQVNARIQQLLTGIE